MKTSRAVTVVGLSAAVLAAGWVSGSGALTPPSSSGALTQKTTSGNTGATTSTNSGGSGTATNTGGSGSAASGTFDGQAVGEPYGNMQVEITVKAGTITGVTMLQQGSRDGTSQSINAYALPQLTQEVLAAQSAKISGISGASFTSQAFVESLTSAITAAGLA